ncbi:hypothetical protein OsI_01401 [Oryza sativa Indica Group]|uniref:Uncharacterized protein n=1 Tax=Oryza sativa subsp. indica TaxID=39946 RepID=A2WNH3_ORYSI|nr:hypothetical protein OsI_01401 [Oryza sativa Indica Group]
MPTPSSAASHFFHHRPAPKVARSGHGLAGSGGGAPLRIWRWGGGEEQRWRRRCSSSHLAVAGSGGGDGERRRLPRRPTRRGDAWGSGSANAWPRAMASRLPSPGAALRAVPLQARIRPAEPRSPLPWVRASDVEA